jgi:acyl-coenzyme A thioesterase PaaI-like protein
MQINTHKKINQKLCGKPISLKDGRCLVELSTTEEMKADNTGLIHGGFIFSTADYAAMLAVNHPNVVLGKSTFKFINPVKVGETVYADAKIMENLGEKMVVHVQVKRDLEKSNEILGEGKFTCFTPNEHILKRGRK